jgi:hypothetical protein
MAKTSESKIRVETDFYSLSIYINDRLHLKINLKQIIAIQSWINRKNKYIIEYSTKDQDIRSEYQHKEDWQEILKQLSLIDFN